ncbi:hypothetical protein ADUPG1_000633 [Aduncisulcus paluster]|uniref:Uncharacterized protein n=1 Tax=Aduncisulcus paluster TaxID=2918883 RepID=A0ABQ5K778_9EUKA|nr:hypothetical protein ADUPG1_000633 [Aduncisulcus paluster]
MERVKKVWCLGIQWYLDGVKVVKKKKKSVLAVKMGIINLPFEERKLNKWIFEVATVDDTPEAMTEVLEAIKVEMERLQNGTYCGSNLTEKRVFDDVIREEWASVRADKPEISCDDYLAWCTSKGIIPVFFVGIILYMDGVQIDGRGGTALCVRFTLCNFASTYRLKDAAWVECTVLEERSKEPSMAVLSEFLDDLDHLHKGIILKMNGVDCILYGYLHHIICDGKQKWINMDAPMGGHHPCPWCTTRGEALLFADEQSGKRRYALPADDEHESESLSSSISGHRICALSFH